MRVTRNYLLQKPVITRAKDEAGPGTFTGHAAVFEQRTLIGGPQWGFVERVMPGAFASALSDPENDCVFLRDHDPSRLFARQSSGTLELAEDGVGLRTDASFPDTREARDTVRLLERGDLRGMSFAFAVYHDEWEVLSDDDPTYPGLEQRSIWGIKPLYDVSVVTYPAYPTTDAGMRSLDGVMQDLTRGRLLSDVQKRTLVQLVVDTDPLGNAYSQPASGPLSGVINDDPDLKLQNARDDEYVKKILLESVERASVPALEEAQGKITERLAALIAARRSLHVDDAQRWMAAFQATYGKVTD